MVQRLYVKEQNKLGRKQKHSPSASTNSQLDNIFPKFMKLEGLLLCSQQLTTSAYPEANKSTPSHSILYDQF
jgi:hypothetical protein